MTRFHTVATRTAPSLPMDPDSCCPFGKYVVDSSGPDHMCSYIVPRRPNRPTVPSPESLEDRRPEDIAKQELE